MGEVELLALYWTVSGPVDVHYGREWSTFDWRDRCAQAARVGFSGLGLWHADVVHQLQTRTLKEMQQIFDDAGLRYLSPDGQEARGSGQADPPRRVSADKVASRDSLVDPAALDAFVALAGVRSGQPAPLPLDPSVAGREMRPDGAS